MFVLPIKPPKGEAIPNYAKSLPRDFTKSKMEGNFLPESLSEMTMRENIIQRIRAMKATTTEGKMETQTLTLSIA